MARTDTSAVELEGPSDPWFLDTSLIRVFSGADLGMKCVCAIGPADFSRSTFAWAQNPRNKLWRVGREDPDTLVVHEALWFPLTRAKDVLGELLVLLDRARVVDHDGWRRFPKRYLRPLMLQAAEKAGVTGLWHAEFHAQALEVETLKLQAQMAKVGVDPKVVATFRCV
jgi:hypothetical protein